MPIYDDGGITLRGARDALSPTSLEMEIANPDRETRPTRVELDAARTRALRDALTEWLRRIGRDE